MLKMTARLAAVALCFAASGFAVGEEQPIRVRPQVLNDAELDSITAGAISFGIISVFNPGNAQQDRFTHFPFVTVNAGGPPPTGVPTEVVIFLVTPGHVVQQCSRAAC